MRFEGFDISRPDLLEYSPKYFWFNLQRAPRTLTVAEAVSAMSLKRLCPGFRCSEFADSAPEHGRVLSRGWLDSLTHGQASIGSLTMAGLEQLWGRKSRW